MMVFDSFFASVIGYESNLKYKETDYKLIKKCYEIQATKEGNPDWILNPYSTFYSHNICKDKDFEEINTFVARAVKNYCIANKYDAKAIQDYPTEGWINIYKKGDSQEFHVHAQSAFSAVYYLKVPENSAMIHFKAPFVDMILPDTTENTRNNIQTADIVPKEGSVIVFRSHLEHMVQQHNANEERISLAYNFYRI